MAAEEEKLDLSGGQITFLDDPFETHLRVVGEYSVVIELEDARASFVTPRLVCLCTLAGIDEDGKQHLPQFDVRDEWRTQEEMLDLPGDLFGSRISARGGISTQRNLVPRMRFARPVKKISLACRNILLHCDDLYCWRFCGGDFGWPDLRGGVLPDEPWAARAREKIAALD